MSALIRRLSIFSIRNSTGPSPSTPSQSSGKENDSDDANEQSFSSTPRNDTTIAGSPLAVTPSTALKYAVFRNLLRKGMSVKECKKCMLAEDISSGDADAFLRAHTAAEDAISCSNTSGRSTALDENESSSQSPKTSRSLSDNIDLGASSLSQSTRSVPSLPAPRPISGRVVPVENVPRADVFLTTLIKEKREVRRREEAESGLRGVSRESSLDDLAAGDREHDQQRSAHLSALGGQCANPNSNLLSRQSSLPRRTGSSVVANTALDSPVKQPTNLHTVYNYGDRDCCV